jgi:phosphoribosylformylglycinamidine cyclo-ligase
MNYKDAGVDIEAGRSFVEKIKKKAPTIGGFNGMVVVPSGYEKAVLVSATDGVGTKLNVASVGNYHKGVGIDLVAMCVNDVITCGAKPLYFLDYIACGKLEEDKLGQVIEGVIEGCKICDMELIGGETAEMPRMYSDGKYDLAGFCTGIVEQSEVIDGSLIKSCDVVIGIESSGLHSNGYSLINNMLWRHKIFYKDMPELLTPTHLYAPLVMDLIEEFPILGMSHITGGGIPENLPRCLPEGLGVYVDYNSWSLPKIFSTIMCAGEIPEEEMKNTFNMGIGYCLVVPEEVATDVQLRIHGHGFESWVIGEIYDI